MSSVRLVFSSDAGSRRTRPTDPPDDGDRRVRKNPPYTWPAPDPPARTLASLPEGARGSIAEVRAHAEGRADRLLALGVTPGASVTVLQTFPGVVFLCDQTELAVERNVADAILVRVGETRP
ncbi:MAG: ferrous iron transport protein A [Acidobacteria bacterium]|nr:ferrous iron transport protein A [Acidobacteriota bacterium]